MTVLYWLVVPLLVTVLASVWVAFAHRARPPADPKDSMAEHQRFREAMERPAPGQRDVPRQESVSYDGAARYDQVEPPAS